MGFFAGIEMAFYSANRLAIELRKKQGGTTGQLLGEFTESPVRFLGSTLIGFNIFLVFFGLQASNVMRPMWEFAHVASYFIRLFVEIILSHSNNPLPAVRKKYTRFLKSAFLQILLYHIRPGFHQISLPADLPW